MEDGPRVCLGHLPAFKSRNGPQHKAQMKRIAAWLEKHPEAVVLGDFNAEPGSKWLDPMRAVGAQGVSKATHGTKHLDQAWSIDSKLRAVRTVEVGSDHRALVVKVTLGR